jgi:putative membrane protein
MCGAATQEIVGSMPTPLLIPLDAGDFAHEEGPPFAFLLGFPMFLLFLLLVFSALFLLHRTGRIAGPPWMNARRSPESEAKRVLADRFARGEISSDEFLERASVLNWTPGSDTWDTHKRRKR